MTALPRRSIDELLDGRPAETPEKTPAGTSAIKPVGSRWKFAGRQAMTEMFANQPCEIIEHLEGGPQRWRYAVRFQCGTEIMTLDKQLLPLVELERGAAELPAVEIPAGIPAHCEVSR